MKSTQWETESNDRDLNPFDPTRFRLVPDYRELTGTRKEFVKVSVRKPTKFEWVRTCPDFTLWFDTRLLYVPEEREPYLVDPCLWEALTTETRQMRLVPTMTRQGAFFLWAMNLSVDGRVNSWNDSGLAAAEQALDRWIRVVPNMQIKSYEIITAKIELPNPEFPTMGLSEMLQLAFRNRIIDSPDHTIPRTLRGELK